MVDLEVDVSVRVVLGRFVGLFVQSWAALWPYVGGLGPLFGPYVGGLGLLLEPKLAVLGRFRD